MTTQSENTYMLKRHLIFRRRQFKCSGFILLALIVTQLQAFGKETGLKERVESTWKSQANAGEDFSYVMYPWHNNGQYFGFGWIQPNRIYYSQGSETWKATFVLKEKLSDILSIVEVLVTHQVPARGSTLSRLRHSRIPAETTRTRTLFLFTGFDFSDLDVERQIKYSGGVIKLPDREVVRLDGERVKLAVIEQTALPPLPKHAAEVGVGVRTWTDDTGNHTLEGAFEKLVQGMVIIVKPDGEAIEVPLDRLSNEDQAQVETLASYRPKGRTSSRRRGSRESFSDSISRKARGWAEASIRGW